MKYFTLLCCFYWTLSSFQSSGQVILNGDFEVMDSCPNNLGQVFLCHDWHDVVMNADYYNCGLSTFPYVSNSTAFSGTGFIGFASYGNAAGAAEAFGQVLTVPIMPGTTGNITLASKKSASGTYSQNCGGVAVYGFKGAMTLDTVGAHLSQIPNAFLLASSPMIQNSSWATFTFSFTATDTVNAIAITNEHTPGCAQCIFIDALSIVLDPNGNSELENPIVHIYPNPSQGMVTINIGSVKSVKVMDVLGKVSSVKLTITDNKTVIENLPGGVSFIQIQFENGKLYTQRIINLD